MTRNRIRAVLLAACVALFSAMVAGVSPEVARAQNSSPAPPESDAIIKATFEVVAMLAQSLEVRSLSNPGEVHTFTYSAEVRPQMLKMQSAGGYRYGDRVVVWYRKGTDVALKIKGKPSKPR